MELQWIGLGALVGFYFFYKFFSSKQNNFTAEVHEVLTSDKYKVKGRFD